MSSKGAQTSGVAPLEYKWLRELGSRAVPSFAAIREPRELLVTARFSVHPSPGAVEVPPETLAQLIADAESLAKNWHPNVARVRHVDASHDAVVIGSELVDGATLADLVLAGKGDVPLPMLVRILLDVLAGVHALHALSDAGHHRLGFVHGELCPTNVVVGKDGIARVVHAVRPRKMPKTARSEGLGYTAPEVLEGGALDARAEVYAAGVILWEGLARRRLFPETDPARILARQRQEEIVTPAMPAGSPLAYLTAIAARALSFEPGNRYRNATEMASELRRPKTAQIASGSVVAGWLATVDGDRIRARRMALDPSGSGPRRRPTVGEIEDALAVRATAPTRDEHEEAPSSSHRTMPPASRDRDTLAPPASVET